MQSMTYFIPSHCQLSPGHRLLLISSIILESHREVLIYGKKWTGLWIRYIIFQFEIATPLWWSGHIEPIFGTMSVVWKVWYLTDMEHWHDYILPIGITFSELTNLWAWLCTHNWGTWQIDWTGCMKPIVVKRQSKKTETPWSTLCHTSRRINREFLS